MSKNDKRILIVGIAIFAAAVTAIGAWKLHVFRYDGIDLAIYNQVFWNTVHGHLFASSIHAPSYLGDHAEWLLILLAPLYAIFKYPLTLVFLQAVALGISTVPIYLIAKKIFSEKSQLTTHYSLLPLTVASLWLLNPYVWNLALYEFHLLPFAIPLLLFAAWFFIEKRFWPFLIFIITALLVREDVPLAVVGFSLLALIEKPRRGWRWILVPFALAATVFVIDQAVISRFNPDGGYKYLIYYHWLGGSLGEIVKNFFLHPLAVLAHVATVGTLELVLGIALPLALLPFLRPRYLILSALPFIQLLLTAPGGSSIVLETQYCSLLLPGVFIAGIFGLQAALSMPHLATIRPIIPVILGIATIYSLFTLGPGAALWNRPHFDSGIASAYRQATALIPKDATVASSFAGLPQLSGRTDIYSFNYGWLGVRQFGLGQYDFPRMPDFLLLDDRDFIYYTASYPKTDWTAAQYPKGPERMRRLLDEGGYGIVFRMHGVTLLSADTPSDESLLERFPSIEQAPAVQQTDADMGPMRLVGYSHADGWRLLLTPTQKISTDLVLKANGELVPLGNGIYPTSEWQPGEAIVIPLPDSSSLTLEAVRIEGALYLDALGSSDLKLKTDAVGGPVSLPQPATQSEEF